MKRARTKSKEVPNQLERLSDELKQYTSLRAVFLRGIIYGAASALGATAVAALLIGLFYRVAKPIFEHLPLPLVTETLELAE